MRNIFLKYGLAKLLKDGGFNEPCIGWIAPDEYISVGIREVTNDMCAPDHCAVPTYDQILNWLRVKHKIYIELIIDGWQDDNNVSEEYIGYRAFIWQIGKPKPHYNDDLGMSDYYTILEVAIKESLKLI